MTESTSRSWVTTLGFVLFGVGLLAILVIFGLHATGGANLPTWLNLLAMLAPAGLVVGVLSAVLRARRDSR